ncbi:MAG: hypothetical protein VX248_11415 [Pseudomonadota bacterium]|nr:hypothetical protein [Pseudomonadota bacterium]
MNDLSPMIDLDRTRANMRRFGTSEDQSGGNVSGGISAGSYRDRDMMPIMPMSAPVPSSPAPVNPVEAPVRATPQPQRSVADPDCNGSFEDLDATPLNLSSEPPAQPATPPAPEDVTPAEPATPQPQASLSLTPAVMRRIILAATTAPNAAPAFGRAQANIGGRGLCFGIGRFCQIDGSLGVYLKACKDEDAAAYAARFTLKDHDLSEQLLQVCTSDSESGRMAPVGGQELWSRDWIAVFKEAAKHPAFQDMQFRAAAETRLIPLVDVADQMNMTSERALAMIVDRAVQTGVSATEALIRSNLSAGNGTRQNIAMLAGLAAASDLPGRAPQLAVESGPSDAPLSLKPEME